MSFLSDFFINLNNRQVQYVVLRNYNSLPFSTDGSDLDIYISRDHLSVFKECLKHLMVEYNGRLVSIIESKVCPRFCLLGLNESSWGLMIDLHIQEIKYRGAPIISADVMLKSTTKHNDITVLNQPVDCLISLFKELLNNKRCTDLIYNNFIQHSLHHELLKNVFSDNSRSGIIPRLLEFRDTIYSDTSVKRLYNVLDKYYPRKWSSSIRKVGKLKRLFRKPGFVISFLGTDGSGKSTLIERIMPAVKDAFHNTVYYKHLRPGLMPPLSVIFGNKKNSPGPVTNPHASSPSGFIGSLIRFTYYLTDYFIGYYIKIFPRKATKASVWLFDRYYYDYYFDQRRSRISLPYALIRAGQMFIPEPDLIICLGTDPGVIHSRKPELSLSEIEQQVTKLREFASKHKRAVWIDTSCGIDESSREVIEAIIKVMAKRFESVTLQ